MFEHKRVHKPLSMFNIAVESIDFQSDKFGNQLESILYDMEKFIQASGGNVFQARQRLADSELVNLLSDTIFKRLGIKTKIIVKTTCPGAIMPMFYNENHVLLKPMWRGQISGELPDQAKLIKKAKDAVGTIDLKNAKVGGIFSEYQHTLWLDVVGNLQTLKMSVPEITAVLLHELGHAFTYYEFSDRLESTNQVLANLSREVRGGNNDEKRHFILKELAGRFGVKEQEFDDILNEKNSVIFGVKLFDKYIKFVKSQMPNAKYSDTSSEQLADNFAARFGYGRYLISGLDRLYIGAPEKVSDSGRMMMTFGQFILEVIAPAVWAIATIMGGSIVTGVLIALFFSFLLVFSGDASADMTYDVLKMRYKRIRQQYIEMIKQLDMDKEALRNVVDSVHFIDNIIQNTAIYRTIYNRVANFLFSWHRNAKKDIELQYLIEELTSNNLFLKSAELEVLA